MSALSSEVCEACRAGAPKVSDEELAALLREIPGWTAVVVEGMLQLQREFSFANFVEAMAFTQRVADIAEEADHHPALLTEWGKVTVNWWTHKINGLHRNDFILAARTDECLNT